VTISRAPWLRLRRGGDSWWGVAGTLAALVATSVAAAALLLHQIATPWKWTIALTAFSHQLMWAAPVGVLAALLARRAATAIAACIATLLVGVIQLPPYFAHGVGARDGREIVVLQANLEIGSADPVRLTETVRDRHVDLLATEELTIDEQRRLGDAGLATVLPHRYTVPLPDGGGGIGIWSRFPLSDTHDLPGYQLGVLTVRVAVPGAPLTFVAVHLLPPVLESAGVWRTEIANLKTALHGMRASRVLVAGDFNATVDHAQYRALLHNGYRDAAEATGAGYLPTYPTDRWYGPLIGIDHVLTRGAASPISAATMELPGSDHRALLVRAVLT
jgi:endonuclease/exonuclease/phosphatase (EEP) superfamily protein YafD